MVDAFRKIFKTAKKNPISPYKFKSLKTYSSTEWLANGQKKYRSVFESGDTGFIYAELSIYNKLFDKQSWPLQLTLKCFRLLDEGQKQELCSLEITKEVPKEKAIYYVREGWGHEEKGHFWKRGDYTWEAYIQDEHVGKHHFYVEEPQTSIGEGNPYFSLEYIRLYEAGDDRGSEEMQTYLKQFDASKTRFIWAELNVINHQTRSWFCEITFNFFNEAGQLKGSVTELRQVKPTEDELNITSGWGSAAAGAWFPGRYRLEIVFMDRVIAAVPFTCADKTLEGVTKPLFGNKLLLAQYEDEPEIIEAQPINQLVQEFDKLVGLDEIKEKVKSYIEYLEFIKLRKEVGFAEDQRVNLHTVFKGNPGTGKTTVAKLLGRIFHSMGLLSNGHLHEVGRNELIGQYIGQTAPKVVERIEKARGGVLFVDEAYALNRSEEDDKDYGNEVIEVLVKEMSDGKGDLAIFMAGYPDEMDILLNSNPGLKSRFKMNFDFPDYLPQELVRIADEAAGKQGVRFTKEARHLLREKLTEEYRNRDRSFGNARMAASLIEDLKMSLGIRIMRQIPEDQRRNTSILETITKADVEATFARRERQKPEIGINEAMLDLSLTKLHSLIGLDNIKREISELVELVRFYRESGKDILGHFSLHTAFKGNPGTGKTTVARILADLYKALGILERGHLVECERESLVSGFAGQTAAKTRKMIEKAHGGILFIDEAYSLANDFGQEAIEVILKAMEDDRGNFVVIVAGYPREMEQFLRMNPGLKSRFDRELYFQDFAESELYEIAHTMLQSIHLVPHPEANKLLQQKIRQSAREKDRYFGNARAIRKLIEQASKQQNLRIAALPISQRDPETVQTLLPEDIRAIQLEEESMTPVPGFRV